MWKVPSSTPHLSGEAVPLEGWISDPFPGMNWHAPCDRPLTDYHSDVSGNSWGSAWLCSVLRVEEAVLLRLCGRSVVQGVVQCCCLTALEIWVWSRLRVLLVCGVCTFSLWLCRFYLGASVSFHIPNMYKLVTGCHELPPVQVSSRSARLSMCI